MSRSLGPFVGQISLVYLLCITHQCSLLAVYVEGSGLLAVCQALGWSTWCVSCAELVYALLCVVTSWVVLLCTISIWLDWQQEASAFSTVSQEAKSIISQALFLRYLS